MNEPQSEPTVKGDDYRKSHLQRGGTYDATIAGSPFDDYMARFEQAYLKKLVPDLFPGKKARYLDFACGTARITSVVHQFCGESIGVDISPSMLAEARLKCPSVRFVEADLTKDAADIGMFDLVTSFRFFGNAQHELRIAVLKALNRLLRTNSYLIINSHRNPHSISALLNNITGGDNQGMDLHYFKLKRLLRSCGFEIVSSRPVGAWMFRHSMHQAADFDSATAQRRESLFSSRIFSPLAPDVVIVARKAN